MDIERRATTGIEVRAESGASPKLVGLAAAYDRPAQLGRFVETIKRGAFTRTLQANDSDVVALLEHNPGALLGRKSAGSLTLRESERGLEFSIAPPNTSAGRDAIELVRRGDLRGCSFGFRVHGEDGESWSMRDGTMTRELRDIDLVEVSLCCFPAYADDTSVALRSLTAMGRAYPWRLAALNNFLATV